MMLKERMIMRVTEHMLIEEIEFWQSMIESQQDSQSEQTAERMNNARDLAERKLLMIQKEPALIGDGFYFTDLKPC